METASFSEDFLSSLSDDVDLAQMAICEEFISMNLELKGASKNIGDYFNALAILRAYAQSKNITYTMPSHGSNPNDTIKKITQFFITRRNELNKKLNDNYLNGQTEKYAAYFDSVSTYKFSDSDFTKIQEIINELRNLISQSKIVTENHRRRLLERLERMQSELHKSTSDLDRFWGFIGETGIVVGKFGNDIKPIVDRVRELANIVWKTVRLKENLLSSGSPFALLDNNDKN